MFGKDFVITCDHCGKQVDTGEKDSVSCNLVASSDGWVAFRSSRSSKTLHLCPDCNDKDECNV